MSAELPKGTVKVKAYLFDCTSGKAKPLEGKPLLNKNLELHKGIIGKAVELSEVQIKTFLMAFNESEKFSPAAGCHIPHHGLVFYDKNYKAIGYYDICFQCSNVSSSIKDFKSVDFKLQPMKKLFKEMGFPILEDFTEYSKLFNKQKKR